MPAPYTLYPLSNRPQSAESAGVGRCGQKGKRSKCILSVGVQRVIDRKMYRVGRTRQESAGFARGLLSEGGIMLDFSPRSRYPATYGGTRMGTLLVAPPRTRSSRRSAVRFPCGPPLRGGFGSRREAPASRCGLGSSRFRSPSPRRLSTRTADCLLPLRGGCRLGEAAHNQRAACGYDPLCGRCPSWRSAVRRTRLSIFSPVGADNCLPQTSPPSQCLLPTAHCLLPTVFGAWLTDRPCRQAGTQPPALKAITHNRTTT